MKFSPSDIAFARRAIASGKATDEEIAFLDTCISLTDAGEQFSKADYNRLQSLTGGHLTVEGSIFDRGLLNPAAYYGHSGTTNKLTCLPNTA